MIQHVLTEIGGIGMYGVISISLFFTVFGATLIRALLLKKAFLESMSALPLLDDCPYYVPNSSPQRGSDLSTDSPKVVTPTATLGCSRAALSSNGKGEDRDE